MKGFVAVTLATISALVLFAYDHGSDNIIPSSLRTRRRLSIPTGLSVFNDPKGVAPKGVAPRLSFYGSTHESAALNELADINIWGTPAKLTSFGYKWKDDKCSNKGEGERQPKKKRAALCLYGGIGSYEVYYDGSSTADISKLINVDWVAALYDKNILPEGDFELDLFIHTWSDTYFCTLARSFDGTRFSVRSIIAEPNERHMK